MNLAFIVLVIVAFLNGCVSLGYHQRKVAEVKQDERAKAILLAEQVRDKRLLVRDMITILRDGK